MRKAASALLLMPLLTCFLPTSSAAADDIWTTNGWKFELTPYAWMAGISGDVEIPSRFRPGAGINVGLDASFTDIVSNLSQIPVMGMAEARNGRFAIIGDLVHMQVEQDADTRGAAFGSAEARITSTIGTLLGTYQAMDVPWQSLEFGAGVRVWSVSTKLTLTPGILPGETAKKSVTFVDPVLAARYRAHLHERLGLTLYADIGGFGVGSEITWQALGTIDFAATPWLDLRVGYRYLAVEYRGDRARLNLDFSGPYLAATFKL